jgi:hypothetical protein
VTLPLGPDDDFRPDGRAPREAHGLRPGVAKPSNRQRRRLLAPDGTKASGTPKRRLQIASPARRWGAQVSRSGLSQATPCRRVRTFVTRADSGRPGAAQDSREGCQRRLRGNAASSRSGPEPAVGHRLLCGSRPARARAPGECRAHGISTAVLTTSMAARRAPVTQRARPGTALLVPIPIAIGTTGWGRLSQPVRIIDAPAARGQNLSWHRAGWCAPPVVCGRDVESSSLQVVDSASEDAVACCRALHRRGRFERTASRGLRRLKAAERRTSASGKQTAFRINRSGRELPS